MVSPFVVYLDKEDRDMNLSMIRSEIESIVTELETIVTEPTAPAPAAPTAPAPTHYSSVEGVCDWCDDMMNRINSMYASLDELAEFSCVGKTDRPNIHVPEMPSHCITVNTYKRWVHTQVSSVYQDIEGLYYNIQDLSGVLCLSVDMTSAQPSKELQQLYGVQKPVIPIGQEAVHAQGAPCAPAQPVPAPLNRED